MPKERTATLETGTTTLAVTIDGNSQVELAGTFGSVVLTGPSGLVTERTIVADGAFSSVMTEMLFTLTGAGPVQVTVYPTRIANISKFKLTA